jgi:cytochrome c-type biogenesis protein CcmH/NrfG
MKTNSKKREALLSQLKAGRMSTAELLALKVEDCTRFVRLGSALAKEQDFSGAQAAAEVATQCNPKRFEAWALLGMARAKQKLLAEAAPAYMKALELKPDDVACWAALGEIFIGLSDYERASSALRQALTLDPHSQHPAGRRARAVVGRTISLLKKKT